ncbi:MAG: response regulator transcription factor [Clostridia bacterium]|nr:response regulator transcription factor [Clostridia bacterium]MBQ5760941.1 response regulator transcription factor [Clostridia bacterium]
MSNKHTVLIIEDETNIRNFMAAALSTEDYKVLTARDGQQGLVMISSYHPDVILLDLGLPDMDGMKIIRNVREWSLVPIIVVSARGMEEDKVRALDAGADDYVTKPFGTSELLARIRSALRHWAARKDISVQALGIFRTGELMIDFDKRRVTVRGEEVHLTQNEYKIVAILSKYAGRVMTYDYIIKEIWGPYAKGDNQILRVNMANIRRKIEDNPADPRYIITEIGVGYRMSEEE